MSTPRPTNPTQLSSNLPGLTHHITGHDPDGQAIVQSTRPGNWTHLMNDTMGFNVIYTTSQFPATLTNDADLKAHDELMAKKAIGLVNPNGTVARMVDFGPGAEPVMHRTKSLDYGIVVEGEVEMLLDGGVVRVMGRGDVAVQRGTNHAWRNRSGSGWARMFFVLQDCEEVVVEGRVLGEDVSAAPSQGLERSKG